MSNLFDDLRLTLGDATADVLHERIRQIEIEGWTAAHDDEHDKGEMADAAAAYALSARGRCRLDLASAPGKAPWFWPWSQTWWKPKTRRQDLVRAGALIIAEIERLDRAEQRAKREPAA
tara:strand:- start:136 stop:492 length:357 start_codon:yes stop_codon:yes gene_type:complete